MSRQEQYRGDRANSFALMRVFLKSLGAVGITPASGESAADFVEAWVNTVLPDRVEIHRRSKILELEQKRKDKAGVRALALAYARGGCMLIEKTNLASNRTVEIRRQRRTIPLEDIIVDSYQVNPSMIDADTAIGALFMGVSRKELTTTRGPALDLYALGQIRRRGFQVETFMQKISGVLESGLIPGGEEDRFPEGFAFRPSAFIKKLVELETRR